MYKFKTTDEIYEYLNNHKESNDFRKNILEAIKGTEEVNEYVDESWVLIANNEQERKAIEEEFNISELTEEVKFLIHEDGFSDWVETIFILDDTGTGLVLFERAEEECKTRPLSDFIQ